MKLSIDEVRSLDERARHAACSVFDRPVVLEAGAGTGKTATLVARVLSWCLGPGWDKAQREVGDDEAAIAVRVLARVVAITFTDRAAVEMEARLAEALTALREGEPVVGFKPGELGIQEEGLAQRAARLEGARENAQIGTIHAFCRRLLAEYPIEARIHPGFEVDADGSRARSAIDAVLARTLPDVLGAEPDEDFVALASLGFGPEELAVGVGELLAAGVEASALELDPFPKGEVFLRTSELRAAVDELLPPLSAALAGVKETQFKVALRIVRGLEALDAALARCETIETLCEIARKNEVEAAFGDLQKWGKGEVTQSVQKQVGELAERLPAPSRRIHGLLKLLRRVDPEVMRPATRVMGRLLAAVRVELRSSGVETFSGLLSDASSLLESSAGVRKRVRESMDLLLVDEFQDTDPLQYKIVSRLSLEGEDRPSLFLVGDPKQSIYAWRNADLAAYMDFVGRVEQDGGERFALRVNFRSAPPILDEVARVSEPTLVETVGLQPPFESLVPGEKNEGDPGFVDESRRPIEHWGAWAPAGEDDRRCGPKTLTDAARGLEARAVARDIAELHAKGSIQWKDAALLIRTTTARDVYLDELRRAGVPCHIERDTSYYRMREVRDAAAWVRAIFDPEDTIALVAALRSPWGGVPDAAWIPLWKHRVPQLARSLGGEAQALDAALRAGRAAALDVPDGVVGLERVRHWPRALEHAIRTLDELRRSARCDPADRFVTLLREQTLAAELEAARFMGDYRFANLERFFRRLLELLRTRGESTREVLRELRAGTEGQRDEEAGLLGDEDLDAVRVTTIHKSKGLEFEHVYLVDLHHANSAGGSSKRCEVALDPAGEVQLSLFGTVTLGWAAVEERRETVGAAEEARTLYVATTRAKRRLVLTGKWPDPTSVPDWDGARSLADLVFSRHDLPGDLLDWWGAATGEEDRVDGAGVRWRLLGGGEAVRASAARPAGAAPSFEDAREEAERLAGARRAARERAARVLVATASSAALEQSESVEARSHSISRDAARVAGTAVHRGLERLDLEGDLSSGLAAARDDALPALAALTEESDRAAAEAAVDEVFARMSAGTVVKARLQSLAPHVIARELPLLLAGEAEGDGPVGAYAGSLDLLARDPESGELVVVDFKTDHVSTEADIEALAARYAPQGAVYTEAVRRVFGEESKPRFELWFLHADRVV